MTEHSQERPQVEVEDRPASATDLVRWAAKILEIIPVPPDPNVGPTTRAWLHQRTLWEASHRIWEQRERTAAGDRPEHPFTSVSVMTNMHTTEDVCEWITGETETSYMTCGLSRGEHRG